MLSFHIRRKGNTYDWSLCEGDAGIALCTSITDYHNKELVCEEIERIRREVKSAAVVDDSPPDSELHDLPII